MPNVVALPQPGFNADVIERLEGLLDDARRGEIISLCYVCDLRGGLRATGHTGTEDLDLLSGYLARLQYLTQQRICV